MRLYEVSYFKADEKYVSVVTKHSKSYILDTSLKQLEEKLPASFIRVHKAYLVNKNLVKEIESKAPVDRHLADQILPFMALAGGSIKTSEVTSHCRTNIYTIHQFMGEVFKVDESYKTISSN